MLGELRPKLRVARFTAMPKSSGVGISI